MTSAAATAGPERLAPARAAIELAAAGVAMSILLFLLPAGRAAHPDLFDRVLLPGKIALVVLLASVLVWRGGGSWRDLGLKRPRRWWIIPAGAIVGYLCGTLAAAAVVQLVFPLLHLHAPGVPPFLVRMKGDLAEYLYWLLPVTWGSAAFGEEMLFRGFVMGRLDALLGGRALWAAAVIQALLFGAAHAYLGPAGAIVAGVLGLVLGVVFVVCGRNLWPCILMHGLVDTVSVTSVFLGVAPG